MHGLSTAFVAALASCKIGVGNTGLGAKKNCTNLSGSIALAVARTRIERIGITDSQNRLSMSLRKHRFTLRVAGERPKFRASHASLECSATSCAAARCVQMPTFALRRSFTVCGLALPLHAFITFPTNHPIIARFAFTL